jgi:hypothetical protein
MAAPEKKKEVRTEAEGMPEGTPAVGGKPPGSRRKTLTAAERKRIAEAQ